MICSFIIIQRYIYICIYLITRNHHPPNLPNDDGSKTLSTSASALKLGRLRVLGLVVPILTTSSIFGIILLLSTFDNHHHLFDLFDVQTLLNIYAWQIRHEVPRRLFFQLGAILGLLTFADRKPGGLSRLFAAFTGHMSYKIVTLLSHYERSEVWI